MNQDFSKISRISGMFSNLGHLENLNKVLVQDEKNHSDYPAYHASKEKRGLEKRSSVVTEERPFHFLSLPGVGMDIIV